MIEFGLVLLGIILLAIATWRFFPQIPLRLFVWLQTRVFYRIRTVGIDQVPREGGALLVPNHVSYLDWLFLMAAVDRPVRFLLERSYAEHWFLRPFVKRIGAIAISSRGGPRETLRGLREAGECLDRGELVCIFAEGQITRIGVTLPFKRGIERVLRGRTTPVVPVHLDRLWGKPLSRRGRRLVLRPPKRIPSPILLSFGAPLPSTTPFHRVRNAVNELGADAWMMRRDDYRPLHHAFIRRARRHPFEFAMWDPLRGRVRRFMALVGTIAVGGALRDTWRDSERVGILLPPSNAAALTNLAATIAGRATVNLNYTAGNAALESAIRQAGIRSVITARKFLQKTKLRLPDDIEPIWIEDVVKGISRGERLRALRVALSSSTAAIERRLGATKPPSAKDVATIIFSSGSTGEPKGVELTHFNIASNAEGVVQVFHIEPGDRLLGILPLFHSFGTLMMWISSTLELGVAYLPNPLDADAVGDAVERNRVTLILATPTFLQLYLRRCTPEHFRSLRHVIVGAEKLPMRLAYAFKERFGVFPLEGYGATECSPVITVNVDDVRDEGAHQIGNRAGSVGMPLPGVAVRILDPDTNEETPRGEPGMLWVRGPNVMRGYLGREDLTLDVIHDGWYRTGDIAIQDERGFITITDRLARFSKIGGEMIPHGRIEEALQDAAEREERVFAVTGVPDERRGERIVVLHTLDPVAIPSILDALASGDHLPALFRPRADAFHVVDEIPVLGTGKLDLAAVKRMARNATA